MIDPTALSPSIEPIAEEFLARCRRGESPDPSEYAARHPEHAEEIRAVLPALLALEALKPRTESSAGTVGGRPTRERFGDYRLIREIGRGGMGVVYEAEQESLGRRVALKILPASALLSRHLVERFRRESRAAARLHHTNIVPVYAVGEQDGDHFYAMQKIEGIGLDRLLEAFRAPEPDAGRVPVPGPAPDSSTLIDLATSGTGRAYHREVARVGRLLAEALAYAHGRGVWHRDIKPSNLLIDAAGNPWITDFGLAKLDDGDDLTETGDLLGTVRYMAPERFQGRCDERADIYALGLTLYELLARRPAFTATDRAALIRQVSEQDPPALRKLDPGIPRDLATVVRKAIEKSPGHRYPTAQAMADDLRNVVEDRPVSARRVPLHERAARACRRRPLVSSLVAATAAAVAIGLASTTWLWFRADGERLRADANLRNARAAVDECFAVVSDSPTLRRSGLQGVKAELLRPTLKYYRAFIAENRGDPALRIALARDLIRVGKVEALLGNVEEARAALRSVTDVLGPTASGAADAPEARRLLAAASYGEANLLQGTKVSIKDREEAYRRAIRDLEAVAASSRDDRGTSEDLASAHDNLAVCLRDAGRRAEALSWNGKALALNRTLADADPDDPVAARHLLKSLANRSVLLKENGKADESAGTLEEAARRGEAARGRWPEDPELLAEVAASLSELGNLRAYGGRVAEGLEIQGRSRAIREALVAANPDVPVYRQDLADTCLNMAVFLPRAGKPKDATASVRRACDLYEGLVGLRPEDGVLLQRLALAYNNLSTNLNREGRKDEGLEALRKSTEVRERLVRDHPEIPGYRLDLSTSLGKVGMNRLDAGERDAARDALGRCLELRDGVPSNSPSDPYNTACFYAIYRNLLGDKESATVNGSKVDREACLDRAMASLERAVSEGYRRVEAIRDEPDFAPLRGRPAFRALVLKLTGPRP